MNYNESISFLDDLSKIGTVLGLENIKMLLKELQHPEERLKVIHVAGTNGKGTVCNVISRILMNSNYRVGLFNSPHILSYRETIQINHEMISEDSFARITSEIKNSCQRMVDQGYEHPTVFECFTAIALYYFAEQNVDFSVIEVGLGGREDATNIFPSPLISIINSIGYDHTEFLGTTLEEIAYVKAGIIKQHVPVIVAPNPESVINVIRNEAKSLAAPLIKVESAAKTINNCSHSLKGMTFSLQTPALEFIDLKTKLIGTHHQQNIIVALTAIDLIKKQYNYKIDDASIRAGIESTYLPCRCEYLESPIPMMIDGAHNKDKMTCLVEVLKENAPKPITFIFGALKDKDVEGMLQLIQPLTKTLILTEPLSQRALSLASLEALATPYFKEIHTETDPFEALQFGIEYAKKTNTFLCCVGSLYLSIPLRASLVQK